MRHQQQADSRTPPSTTGAGRPVALAQQKTSRHPPRTCSALPTPRCVVHPAAAPQTLCRQPSAASGPTCADEQRPWRHEWKHRQAMLQVSYAAAVWLLHAAAIHAGAQPRTYCLAPHLLPVLASPAYRRWAGRPAVGWVLEACGAAGPCTLTQLACNSTPESWFTREGTYGKSGDWPQGVRKQFTMQRPRFAKLHACLSTGSAASLSTRPSARLPLILLLLLLIVAVPAMVV